MGIVARYISLKPPLFLDLRHFSNRYIFIYFHNTYLRRMAFRESITAAVRLSESSVFIFISFSFSDENDVATQKLITSLITSSSR